MATSRDILAMLSVQTPGGLVFGTGRKIEGMTLGFELDGKLEPGDVVEWRMELPGLEDTAMGTLRVLAGRKDTGAGVPWWSGLILSLAPDDADVFEVWRRGVEQGTRAFSHSSRAPTDSWLAATTMVGSTDAERRMAVAAQEERRKRRLERAKLLARNAKAWPDPGDIEGGRSVASGAFRQVLSGSMSRSTGGVAPSGPRDAGRPREQIAAALRGRIATEPPPVVEVVRPAAPPPPPAARPVPPPATPELGFTGPVSQPVVYVDKRMASLSFGDPSMWRAVDQPGLLAGRLRIGTEAFGAPGTVLQVWLRLPSGTTVSADARVAAVGDGVTDLAFSLAPAARAMVELG